MDGNRRLCSQLCKAVNDGDPRSVQMLLSQGASPDLVGSKGVAAIHLAVGKETEKSTRCLKLMLQCGADPNIRSSEGLTPLHVAALWGCYQNLKLLLMNGGNPNMKDQDGNTPGRLAEQQENHKCAQLLQQYQASSTDTEEDDLPQFQYSVFSDQTDISDPESDFSFSSRSSMISDFGDALLSSTRHSAGFGPSAINDRQSWRGAPSNRLSNIGIISHHGQDWNKHSGWASEGPSILSSTRMSLVGSGPAMPILQEDALFTDETELAPKATEGPCILTSTRMSAVGTGPALAILHEDCLFADDGALERASTRDRKDALPACPSRRLSRKSVTFRDVDEYFPVFSPESHRQQPASVDTSPFDLSEYSDFLDSKRVATVLHQQGIDVTSPDNVYVFHRDSSESTEEDMEKTVVCHLPLEESDDEEETEHVTEVGMKAPEQPACSSGGSSSTGSSSHYSSCESDHYTSAIETSLRSRKLSPPVEEEEEQEISASVEFHKDTHISKDSDSAFTRQDANILGVKSESHIDSKHERVEDLSAIVEKLTLSDERPTSDVSPEACRSRRGKVLDTETEVGDDEAARRPTGRSLAAGAAAGSEEDLDLQFTPSPFVTGRTRSRLSRCSLRTSRTPESLLSASSLFEQTLPTPIRTRRQTPRPGGDDVFYNSPRCYTPSSSGSSRGYAAGDGFPSGWPDTQTVRAGSSISDSQADTLIISRTAAETFVEPHSLPDTIILEKTEDSLTDGYEKSLEDNLQGMRGKDLADGISNSQADRHFVSRNAAETFVEPHSLPDTIILEKTEDSLSDGYEKSLKDILEAMRGKDLAEARGFLTDDLTSTDEAMKGHINDAPDRAGILKNEDAWITKDGVSQAESASSSSSSSYFSPRRSREDSDPPCTPGTGCTPRYSMSRLSSCRRPQHLANLSYTPGGRPLIQALDEPVDYLYTDTERGHELIETHVPPTANTSLSSSTSVCSSDETVLYDWRSMRADAVKKNGKENEGPHKMVRVGEEEEEEEEEVEEKGRKDGEKEDSLLPETKGMTDKELRRRLVELGESPGPISTRTRPTYLRRLHRMLLESNLQSPQQQKQLDKSHEGSVGSGYSPELCRALRTFELPDCQIDELALCQQFDQPDQNRKWREGIIKSSFNYLLLDPRVTKNLPFRSRTMTQQDCFQTFISSVFYVGKGKRSRPYSHLYEALEYHRGDKTSKKLCTKVQHILQVWKAEQGVISLHCFQNVIPVEAYTREACMVDAIGVKMLTNRKRGDYYGVVSTWQAKRKRELGVHLLYRAMQIFLAEGERQLRPADIRQ